MITKQELHKEFDKLWKAKSNGAKKSAIKKASDYIQKCLLLLELDKGQIYYNGELVKAKKRIHAYQKALSTAPWSCEAQLKEIRSELKKKYKLKTSEEQVKILSFLIHKTRPYNLNS